MIELSTTGLSRKQLDGAIAKVKTMKGFAGPAPQMAALSVRRNFPPDLSGFLVDSLMPLCLEAAGAVSLPEFLSLASALEGKAEACTLKFEIGQSGKPFDVKEESDLILVVGFERWGPKVSLEMGGVSAGARDLEFRKDMFEQLVETAGLAGSIILTMEDGELAVSGEGFRDVGRPEVRKAVVDGARLYRTNMGTLKGRNFRQLSLYLSTTEELEAAAGRCLEHFGSTGDIVETKVSVVCGRDAYAEVREVVSANCGLEDWLLECMAKQKYDLDSIDRMLSETDSMLMPLFEIHDERVEEIFVDVYHDGGELFLFFANEGKEPAESEKAIRELAAALSVELEDGDD